MQEASTIGYFLYLIMIFLPGIGICELLRVWRDDDGLSERVAYAFGVGLAVDTVVLVVRTSGFQLFGFVLKGVDIGTVYAIIALGLIALLSSVVLRRGFAMFVRPRARDLLLFVVILVEGMLFLLYFQSNPIFPSYQSADYENHVVLAQELMTGTIPSVPQGILYFGAHLQLASSLLLVGGEPLVTVQRTMAVLAVLSPLLFYLATSRIFANGKAGLVGAAVYSLSGPIWFLAILNSGLYANFFGMLAALFLIFGFVDLSTDVRAVRHWIVFVGALLMTYFSHYTVLSLLPTLLAIPVIQYLRSRKGTYRFFVPALVTVAPGGVALLLFPGVVAEALALAETGGGVIVGGSPLSDALSGWPFLHYLSLETFSDVALVVMLMLVAVYFYRGTQTKAPYHFMPILWFLSLLVVSPVDVSAWRFSLEALIPLTMMAGLAVSILLPKVNHMGAKAGKATDYRRYLIVLATLAILLSPQVTILGNLNPSSGQGVSAQSQEDVYSALYWLKDNTPTNASYLSISDWRFAYSTLFFGRTTTVGYLSLPTEAITIARNDGAQYVIVTRVATARVFPWNNFEDPAGLKLVYSNDDVKVFRII